VRRVLLLATLLVASVVSAAPAGADPILDGTLSTPTRLTSSTIEVLYYLQLHAGPQEERFSLRLSPPRFATLGSLDEGQTLDGPRAIALQGPGTIGQRSTDGSFAAPCSTSGDHRHAYATGDTTVDLLLPPGSRTTVAVRYRTGRSAPWFDTNARLTFAVLPALVGEYAASSPFAAGPTATARQTLRTAGPAVGGRLAAHLLLASAPGGTVGSIDRAPKRVGRRSPIRLSGKVVPAVRHKKVVLQWARGTGPRHTLAIVRTDSRGRFSGPSWRPGAKGSYELWARYPKQAGTLAPDQTSCPVRFRVR